MTAAQPMPTTRTPGCPFDPPPELAKLREERPISPMSYPDGHIGWLVTNRSLTRAVLADPRFSARSELSHFPFPGAGPAPRQLPPPPPGVFTQTDPPVHTRYRHPLTGQFTVRRMRQLTERIEQIAADHLDAMERNGPGVDLVRAYALPIPSLVICEMLGVPYADRERFTADSAALMRLDVPQEQRTAALISLQQFLHQLVQTKRAEPADDMLSGLLESDFSDDELTNIGFTLLGAGHETTANMLSLGTFALLEHPDQIPALHADPDNAVEELLRYLSIIPGTVRVALEDLELGGVLVAKGQAVTVSIPAANRDPRQWPDPDTFDAQRGAAHHVAFGHGVHQCLGQQLARVEMRVGLPALFRRFPTLRLAIPPEKVPTKDHSIIYGVHELPVTWDA